MRDAMRHRGPDGSGVEVFENVGLVHTRLAIVDVSERAKQPMRHPDADWWISFNGEIFNHSAIRADLDGETFASDGDTETLLHAVARWGPELLPRLNGQFAFAALDLAGRRLLLARDRFGIKPLYITVSDGGIWFASEPAALLAAGIKPSPHLPSWPSIIDSSCYFGESTLLSGIYRLSPGTWTEIPLDDPVTISHRWSSPARHVNPQRQTQLESLRRPSLASQLESALRAAVHDALLSDVPVGTLCSGGVDSSLITALAAEVKDDLVAFGATYKGVPGLEEGPAVRRVAEALGVEYDLLEVTQRGWRKGFVEATVHFGGPLATASSVAIAEMARRARSRGIKVLLTGEGADELFAGYDDPRKAPLSGFFSAKQYAARALEPFIFGNPWKSGGAVVKRVALVARKFRPSGGSWPDGVGFDGYEPMVDETLDEEVERAYAGHSGPRKTTETGLLLNANHSLLHLLNRMDKNMMQVSVEARVPFLDPRVVELALNLPLEARVTPWSKGILRDVARRLLPPMTAYRQKIYGMDFNVGAWIEEGANPKFLAEGVFRDVFEIPSGDFERLLQAARGKFGIRLWSIEVWCRSVFAGESVGAIEKELWPQGP
jgi:asparagine synthase (glutamine-hydrolysing)